MVPVIMTMVMKMMVVLLMYQWKASDKTLKCPWDESPIANQKNTHKMFIVGHFQKLWNCQWQVDHVCHYFSATGANTKSINKKVPTRANTESVLRSLQRTLEAFIPSWIANNEMPPSSDLGSIPVGLCHVGQIHFIVTKLTILVQNNIILKFHCSSCFML